MLFTMQSWVSNSKHSNIYFDRNLLKLREYFYDIGPTCINDK